MALMPCRNYKNGNCSLGDTCKFVHDLIPCSQYPNCPRGTACPFVHPEGEWTRSGSLASAVTLPVTPLTVPRGGTNTATKPLSILRPCFNFKRGSCPHGSTCRFYHGHLPCKFGTACSQRDKCSFDHDDVVPSALVITGAPPRMPLFVPPQNVVSMHTPNPPYPSRGLTIQTTKLNNKALPSTISPVGMSVLQPSTPAIQATYQALPCLFYKKGNCVMGDRCTFLHKLVLCPNVNCKDGDKCRYVHPPPSVIQPSTVVASANSVSTVKTIPCRLFKRSLCTKGNLCNFLHELIPCRFLQNCQNKETCPYVHECS